MHCDGTGDLLVIPGGEKPRHAVAGIGIIEQYEPGENHRNTCKKWRKGVRQGDKSAI